MKTITATVIRNTESNLYIRINNHTVMVPMFQIHMFTKDMVTFKQAKDAYHIYKMTA